MTLICAAPETMRRSAWTQGPGVQHLAFKTDDIFHTLTCMRAHGFAGGFEFMPRASDEYYAALPQVRRSALLGLLAPHVT